MSERYIRQCHDGVYTRRSVIAPWVVSLVALILLVSGCSGKDEEELTNEAGAINSGNNGTAVVDSPNGSTVNVTTGEQGSLPPPIIRGIFPSSGVVGDVIVFDGVFPHVNADDLSASFNGTEVSILGSTDISLVVRVPESASSGPVTVKNGGGSYTTTDDFVLFESSSTPGASWRTRMSGPGAWPVAIAYDGEKYVAGGDSILTSENLIDWRERNSRIKVTDLQWNGEQFVALTPFGDLETSVNGYTWKGTFHSHSDLNSLVYSDSQWLAAGDRFVISADGVNWTEHEIPVEDASINDVSWDGIRFIAVGDKGLVLTSENGIEWDRQVTGIDSDFLSVASSSGLTAVSTKVRIDDPPAIYTSSDGGRSWVLSQEFTPPADGRYIPTAVDHLYYGAGGWIGASDRFVWQSSDGITWNSTPFHGIDGAFIHDGSQFLTFANRLSGGALFGSDDAVSWELLSSDKRWDSVARNPRSGELLAVGGLLSGVSTDDGATWDARRTPYHSVGELIWFDVRQSFLLTVNGSHGSALVESKDGLSWSEIGQTPRRSAIASSSGIIVNVGYSRNSRKYGIEVSEDAINWRVIFETDSNLSEIKWTGDRFIAYGEGTMFSSRNGIDWDDISHNSLSTTIASVAVSHDLMVFAVGYTIFSSDDSGATWTERESNSPHRLRDVEWTGSEFVAVGDRGTVIYSTDGINWEVKTTQYSYSLFAAEDYDFLTAFWTGTTLIAAGSRGLIATSPQ